MGSNPATPTILSSIFQCVAGDALALLDEPWKAKTTLDNLVPIARSRRAAGLEVTALEEIITELERHAPQPV